MSAAPPNLARMFHDACAAFPDAAGYRHRPVEGAPFQDVSFAEAQRRVAALARGLLAGPAPLEPGARVALLCSTRLEWILFDFACLSLGLVTVPIYPSLLAPEVGYILQDAGVRRILVEDSAQLAKIRSLAEGWAFAGRTFGPEALPLDGPALVVDPSGLDPASDWRSLADLEAAADGGDDGGAAGRREELARRLEQPGRDDLATVIYTSGTTGPPKGVLLRHGNVLAMVEGTAELGFFEDDLRTLGGFCFLPLAHAFGRMLEMGSPFYGATLILSSPDTLVEDLVATRPGFVPAAPRVFEKIHARVLAGLPSAPAWQRALFAWALPVGERAREARERGEHVGGLDRLRHAFADRLVFRKFRQRLGLDRCRILLSGSAPLADEIQRFFGALGLPVYEAYGMTEAIPGLTCNRPGAFRRGTVGPALPGVELRLADDGEILARGPNISPGYLGLPEATRETFDDDGWLHTGDVGFLDDDGFLHITDRKKDLIKTSGGKYIAPQKLEGLLKARPLIEDALVVGEGRRYCVALLVVDEDALRARSKQLGRPLDPGSEETRALLEAEVAAVNEKLASFETVKRAALLPERPTVDNGLLTPSFKIRRRAVERRFAALIDTMY